MTQYGDDIETKSYHAVFEKKVVSSDLLVGGGERVITQCCLNA